MPVADLKAAFDKVPWRSLMKRLERKQRRKRNEMDAEGNLRRRITKIYREIDNMVKVEEKRTEEF